MYVYMYIYIYICIHVFVVHLGKPSEPTSRPKAQTSAACEQECLAAKLCAKSFGLTFRIQTTPFLTRAVFSLLRNGRKFTNCFGARL